MVRSFVNLRSVDLGFDAAAVVTGRVSLPSSRYPTDASRSAFFDQLLRRVRSLPGVSAASVVTSRPFACCAPATVVSDPASTSGRSANSPTTDVRFADESYFSTMRIGVLKGDVFASDEPREGTPRAVVSRALARALWASADPVGQSVTINLWGTTTARVIGVVEDVHLVDPRTRPRPELYLSATRFPSSERDIVVRGAGEPDALLASLRGAVASIDATVPLYRGTTLQASVRSLLAQDRFTTLMLGAFASLALLLAAIGVYGVLSGDVASRRKEIGIRLALGAETRNVTRLVVGRAVRPTLDGVVLGLAGALVSTRAMSAMVFGVGTADLRSFAIVIVLLAGVASAATLVPALRATRVSPLEAIRTD
jgi:putative ABC transport system permease protein